MSSASSIPASASHLPALRTRAQSLGSVVLQVGVLSAIYLAMEAVRRHFGWGMPAGLMGFALLALGLFSGWVKPAWLQRGTNWLLADMLLFFVPAMLVVTEYPALIRSQGLQILAVIVLSTACVMAATAFAVDRVYRLELRWSTRHAHQAQAQAHAQVPSQTAAN